MVAWATVLLMYPMLHRRHQEFCGGAFCGCPGAGNTVTCRCTKHYPLYHWCAHCLELYGAVASHTCELDKCVCSLGVILGAPGRFWPKNKFARKSFFFIFMVLIGVYMNTVKFGSQWRPQTVSTVVYWLYHTLRLVTD